MFTSRAPDAAQPEHLTRQTRNVAELCAHSIRLQKSVSVSHRCSSHVTFSKRAKSLRSIRLKKKTLFTAVVVERRRSLSLSDIAQELVLPSIILTSNHILAHISGTLEILSCTKIPCYRSTPFKTTPYNTNVSQMIKMLFKTAGSTTGW